MAVTHIAAATGALGWMLAEWIVRRQPSLLGLCSGLVGGLVAITPAAGFVQPGAAAVIAREHHENYDGTGYPRGLAGQNIPYMARILTIADCFDAMTAKRPYKQALSVEYAVNELEKNSGTQFDPVLVKKFVELIHEGKISIA